MMAVRQRVPNEERSGRTRAKVIEATIDLLHRVGYESTSMQRIIQQAGISRGALLHQFPTKVDLMIAVAEQLVSDDLRHYEEVLHGLTSWERQLELLVDAAWEAFRRPDHQAFLEIWMATRGDDALREQFGPFVAQGDIRTDEGLRRLLADSGAGPDMVAAVAQMLVGSLRGFAIENLLRDRSSRLDAAVDALKRATILQLRDAGAR